MVRKLHGHPLRKNFVVSSPEISSSGLKKEYTSTLSKNSVSLKRERVFYVVEVEGLVNYLPSLIQIPKPRLNLDLDEDI